VIHTSTNGAAPTVPQPPQLEQAHAQRLHLQWTRRETDDTFTVLEILARV